LISKRSGARNNIYEAIFKEKVVVGDVVYIEHQASAVKMRMLLPMTLKQRHLSHSKKRRAQA